jgi:hypothetical protein
MNEIDRVRSVITKPARVWSREEALSKPSPVPASPGVYGWFFRELPAPIETVECVKHEDPTLLYRGISPKKPPPYGKPSAQTLRSRIRYHYRGNAMRANGRSWDRTSDLPRVKLALCLATAPH